jgi:O-antigen ligase
MTLERKSWVALFFSILLQYLLYNKYVITKKINFKIHKTNFKVIIIMITIIILLTGFFLSNELINRQIKSLISLVSNSSDVETASNKGRINLLKNSAIIFLNNPILGVGIENFKTHYSNLTNSSKVTGAHNEFILISTELGVIGFIIYISLWGYSLTLLKKISRYNKLLNLKDKKNIIMILGLWLYGLIIVFFRASGMINMLFLVLPISLSLLFKANLDKNINK